MCDIVGTYLVSVGGFPEEGLLEGDAAGLTVQHEVVQGCTRIAVQ